ncbi:hypothetical protein ACMFMG_012207 [Clarireedia jacksonii]
MIAELTLCPGNFIPTKRNALFSKSLSDEISSLWRNVVVFAAVDHCELTLDFTSAGKTVVVLTEAESCAMEIGGEVRYCGGDTGVKSAAVS